MKILPLMAGIAALGLAMDAVAGVPSAEEMWEIIQQQQRQIDALQLELAATRNTVTDTNRSMEMTRARVEETDQKVDATAESVDQVIRTASAPQHQSTHVGGYGELHVNGGDTDEIDFHRFVLLFGHSFNDRLRFESELELEHSLSGDGKPGEVELEQAYIEYDINNNLSAKGGLFLVPVGILNETHEPPMFYGVERNNVEKNIIPSTWWEGGGALSGRFSSGWGYDLAVHSGLKTSANSSYKIRNGRQKVAEASFEDAAFTGRLKYSGVPGLELAATVQYQQDVTQSSDPLAGSGILFETHMVYQRGPLGLRALYATWDLDGSGPEAIGADEQQGWYIEPSWRVNDQLGLFARYAQWDNQAGDNVDSEFSQTHFGINYWLHDNVVLKADYQLEDVPTGNSDDDRINIGIGYHF